MTGPAQAGDKIRLIRPEFRLSTVAMTMTKTKAWKWTALALWALAALLALRLAWDLLGPGAAEGPAAARNIAETRARGALREEVDTYVRGRLFDTIAAAADELNRETL